MALKMGYKQKWVCVDEQSEFLLATMMIRISTIKDNWIDKRELLAPIEVKYFLEIFLP